MRQEVYADLLFLINFSMDFLCLYLTARFLRRRILPARITFAAIIGGVYSVVALFFEIGIILSLLADAAVCVLMCALTFHRRGRKKMQFLKETAVYCLVSTALGGIMTALFNLLNRFDLPLQSGGDSISSWLFFLLALISGFAAIKSGGILKRMASRKLLTLKIVFDQKSVTLTGLTDTGNIIRDPASGKPVIITDIKATLPILPEPVSRAVLSGRVDAISDIPAKYSTRIRIIPSVTVSGSSLMLGIIPDSITLAGEKGETDVSALFAPMLIPNLPDGCGAIVPGELNA